MCPRVGCVCAGGLESGSLLVLVPVVWFVTPLAQRLVSRSVVAPRCCVASCACIGIVSQGLAKSCISELSVLPQSEASLSGEAEKCKKDGFPGCDS